MIELLKVEWGSSGSRARARPCQTRERALAEPLYRTRKRTRRQPGAH